MFLKRKFRFKSSFCATVISLIVFLIILSLFGFVIYLLITETTKFYRTYSSYILDYAEKFGLYDSLNNMLSSADTLGKMSKIAVSMINIVPLTVTLLIITFASTVLFLNNLSSIKEALLQKLSKNIAKTVSTTLSNAQSMLYRFTKSYMIIYFITFLESVFIFLLIGIKFPIIFAFLTAVADILPILGPGTVFIPLSIFYLIKGNYLVAGTLFGFFIIITVIRQITEPKIVSNTIKIHPILMLSAIYFSIAGNSIWILFYLVILFLLYDILVETGLFTPIFEKKTR